MDNIKKNNVPRKFVSWRRVSTKRQGGSGLGLEAQKSIIDYYVKFEGGEILKDFAEVYTGTDLTGCNELKKAIDCCKENDATLIIAKTDRFRNAIEALQIMRKLGKDKLYFCDLPHTDEFTLGLFFLIAEREAKIISIRTKQALAAKKARGEKTGGACRNRKEVQRDLAKARAVSCQNRRAAAEMNESNRDFIVTALNYQKYTGVNLNGAEREHWEILTNDLNAHNFTTPTGKVYTVERARAVWLKYQKWKREKEDEGAWDDLDKKSRRTKND